MEEEEETSTVMSQRHRHRHRVVKNVGHSGCHIDGSTAFWSRSPPRSGVVHAWAESSQPAQPQPGNGVSVDMVETNSRSRGTEVFTQDLEGEDSYDDHKDQ